MGQSYAPATYGSLRSLYDRLLPLHFAPEQGVMFSARSMNYSNLVIYDGVCVFCNGAVNFIINRDPECRYVFTPMQSDLAQELTRQYDIRNVGFDTFLLIKNGRAYIWTDAAIEIARDLAGLWYLCVVFKVIPRFIRDYFYRLFARNRYKLFGRYDVCMVPDERLQKRFIGV